MKLQEIKIRNFKSIGDEMQTIRVAPITLLFGPNSAGKSTILQSLVFLHEAICNRNLNPDRTTIGGAALDLGGFRNLLHGRDEAGSIVLEVCFSMDSAEFPDYLSEYERASLEEEGLPELLDFFDDTTDVRITFVFRWSQQHGRAYVETYEIRVDGAEVAVINSMPDGRQVMLERLALDPAGFHDTSLFEERSFLDRLSDVLASSPQMTAISGRPLERESLDSLEQRVIESLESNAPSLRLLASVANELSYRTSRSAKNLEQRLRSILEDRRGDSLSEFVGLEGMTDALPDPAIGLELAAESWIDNDDLETDQRFFKAFAQSVINATVCGPLKVFSDWLDQLIYVGPLRTLPPRIIAERMSPDPSGWSSGLAAWERLPTASSEEVAELNFWLGDECLNVGYQLRQKKYRELEDDHPIFRVLEDEGEEDDRILAAELLNELPHRVRVCLVEEDTQLEVMPQDIGVGISQLFPVVALSVYQKDGMAAIEQPELHVHPRLQTELADVFIRYAKTSNVVFLLETHSEHLMLRLLRRVREGMGSDDEELLKSEDLSVIYVESDPAGTRLSGLRVSKDGDFLDDWPNGFFDERDSELFF